MNLVTATLTLSALHSALPEPEIFTLVTERLVAIPTVEHVRAHLRGSSLTLGVFIASDPLTQDAARAAIRSELAGFGTLSA